MKPIVWIGGGLAALYYGRRALQKMQRRRIVEDRRESFLEAAERVYGPRASWPARLAAQVDVFVRRYGVMSDLVFQGRVARGDAEPLLYKGGLSGAMSADAVRTLGLGGSPR